MLVAIDKDKNRIFACDGKPDKDCFCPVCAEPLSYRAGSYNIPHFAHKAKSVCTYGKDLDNKSPWHRHMQELFPREMQEVVFIDENTGEKHIADIFIQETNTIIEFQHSPITKEEFQRRTMFHILAGRRIVWVFDEIKAGGPDIRLKKLDLPGCDWMHDNLEYDWPYSPRKSIASVYNRENLDTVVDKLSICVYLGEAGDTVHRIYKQYLDYKSVTLSLHDIIISGKMDTNEFFLPDRYWLTQDPWPNLIAEYNRTHKLQQSHYPNKITINVKNPRGFRF